MAEVLQAMKRFWAWLFPTYAKYGEGPERRHWRMMGLTTVLFAAAVVFGANVARATDLGGVSYAYKTPPLEDRWAGLYAGYATSYTFGEVAGNLLAGGSTITVPVKPSGWGLGALIGYNWQWGSVVYGPEADLSKFWAKGSSTLVDKIGTEPFVAGVQTSLNWMSTVRGRVGFVPLNEYPFLVYGTAGLAVGGVGTAAGVSLGSSSLDSSFAAYNGIDETKVGWAAGVGLEIPITPHVSWRGEWLHYDLGSSTIQIGDASVSAAHRGELVRFGSSYRF